MLGSLVLLAVSLTGSSVFAQPRKPAPTAPAAPENPATLPAAVEVNDPMLAPVARPKTEIATWEDALNHVRARSTDLRVAAEQVARAEAQSRIALAGALPTITGNAVYTHNLITNDVPQVISRDPVTNIPTIRNIQTPFPDFLTGGAQLTQPLLATRAWYNIGTQDHAIEASKLSYQDAKRVIAVAVANAIVAVVTAERLAELNRLGLRNALTRLELANRRSALGSGTGLDVVRAKQDVETARATLVAGDESLRQAREALGLAIGLPEQVGVPVSVNLNGLETSAESACKPAKSVEERSDIAALVERKEVARRAVTDAKLQFMPTIDARSSVATTTADVGVSPNTTWNIQGVLTVPLWDGGIRYGNMRDARAQEAIAGQNLETARRKAEIEIIQAKRGVSVAEDRRKVAEQARTLSAENDRLTRTAYLEGRGTSLELVAAAQQLREAEIQLALRDFDLVKARVAAILALSNCTW